MQAFSNSSVQLAVCASFVAVIAVAWAFVLAGKSSEEWFGQVVDQQTLGISALSVCFLTPLLIRSDVGQRVFSGSVFVRRPRTLLGIIAVVATALLVACRAKLVVRKLRLPVSTLLAELLKTSKDLSCGDYTVAEPSLTGECEGFAQVHLQEQRQDFEAYLAGLTRNLQLRSRNGSEPTLLFVGAGSLCELRATYPCLAPLSPKVLLVEPNPGMLMVIQQQLSELGLAWPRARIVRAVIEPSSVAQEVLAERSHPNASALMEKLESEGYTEFFRGRQGRQWFFSSFDRDASAVEGDGSFLRRLPPLARDRNMVFRATVWGGSCGEGSSTIQFRLGQNAIEHFREGSLQSWRPLFSQKAIHGRLPFMPNMMFSGESGIKGWAVAKVSGAKGENVTVLGSSCTHAPWDRCKGQKLRGGGEMASLSYKYALDTPSTLMACKRRPLVGGSMQPVIPDSAISASSVGSTCSVNMSRIDSLGPGSAWCPGKKSRGAFIKWDLGSIQDIFIIQLRGGAHMKNEGEWVKTFRLQWSLDDANWAESPKEKEKHFTGNADRNSLVEVELSPPITARYVKLLPIKSHKSPSMRAELMTCDNLQKPFYAFSPQLLWDFDRLPSIFPDASSLDYESLTARHQANFESMGEKLNYTRAEWNGMTRTHVEELLARRLTLAELLLEEQVEREDVSVLSLRTRGRGLGLLADFLSLPGLTPLAVRVEPDVGTDSHTPTVELAMDAFNESLKAKGYGIQVVGSNSSAASEIWAKRLELLIVGSLPSSDATRQRSRPGMWITSAALAVAISLASFLWIWDRLPSRAACPRFKWPGFCTLLWRAWWLLAPTVGFPLFLRGDVGLQTLYDLISLHQSLDGHELMANPPLRAWPTPSCGPPSRPCSEVAFSHFEVQDAFQTSPLWKWAAYSQSWTCEDEDHPSAIWRSKPFEITLGLQISITSPAGSSGSTQSIIGRSSEDLEPSVGGFVGIAIRDEESNLYMLSRKREPAGPWPLGRTAVQELRFSEEDLKGLVGKNVTIDVLDLGLGSGVNMHVSDVALEGACAAKCRDYARRRSTSSEASLGNITEALSGHFAARVARGRRPVILQLGSGSALCELAEILPCLRRYLPKFVFVEPNRHLLPKLRRRLKELQIQPSSAVILRAAVLPSQAAVGGKQVCEVRLPLAPPDSAISAKESMPNHTPNQSRINGSSWCGVPSFHPRPWIQWDLGDEGQQVDLLQTWGLPMSNNSPVASWVTSFSLSYSNDSENWESYGEVLAGPSIRSRSSEIVLHPPVVARYLRLSTIAWHQWPCIRAELFRCNPANSNGTASKAQQAWSTTDFWTFADDLPKQWANLTSSLSDLSALDRRMVEVGHGEAFTDPSVNLGYDQASWNSMLKSHVSSQEARTLSPLAVMKQTQVRPEDVDVLSIDCRGYNLEILQELLEIPGFRPAYLRFEWGLAANLADVGNDTAEEAYLRERLEPITLALADLGYSLSTVGPEITAVRTPLMDALPKLSGQQAKNRLPSVVDLVRSLVHEHQQQRFWAVPACSGMKQAARAMRFLGDMSQGRCCHNKGCFAPEDNVYEEMPWLKGTLTCAKKGARPCTRRELEEDACAYICTPGLTWSLDMAFVQGEMVATKRHGVWSPSKVIGVDLHAEGSGYILGWIDGVEEDQLKRWDKVQPLPDTRLRTAAFILIAAPTAVSLQLWFWKLARQSKCIGGPMNWLLSALGIGRRLRCLFLALAIGHCLGGLPGSRPVQHLVNLVGVCPPEWRGQVGTIALPVALSFRLLSYLAGGPWLGLWGPEPIVPQSANASSAWPDDRQWLCLATTMESLAITADAPTSPPDNYYSPRPWPEVEATAKAQAQLWMSSEIRRQKMQPCRETFKSFLLQNSSRMVSPWTLLTGLSTVFRERSRFQGEKGYIIHVGPRDSACEMRISYYCLSRYKPQVLLLEPNPRAFPGLQALLKSYTDSLNSGDNGTSGNSTDPRIVYGALCPEDQPDASFYMFSESLLQDFPRLTSFFEDISSINRTVVETLHRQNFARSDKNPGYSADEWESMLSYIQEVPMRCYHPESFLVAMRVQPEAVDVLTLDVTGYNLHLLNLFLKMDKFWPSYMRVRWDRDASNSLGDGLGTDKTALGELSLEPTLRALELRGYRLGFQANDMIAVHPSLGFPAHRDS